MLTLKAYKIAMGQTVCLLILLTIVWIRTYKSFSNEVNASYWFLGVKIFCSQVLLNGITIKKLRKL